MLFRVPVLRDQLGRRLSAAKASTRARILEAGRADDVIEERTVDAVPLTAASQSGDSDRGQDWTATKADMQLTSRFGC